MIKKILFSGAIVTLFSFAFVNHFQELVLEKLDAYTQHFPEKVYVQTDKPYYTLGDDIWYAAYLVNGVTHQKSEKSKVVYVELINDKDSIVSHKKLYTNDLSVSGDFEISKDWKPGNYLLRAFTNYMRNSNPDYFFKKQLPIWDLEQKAAEDNESSVATINGEEDQKPEEIAGKRPDLNFYPEGGYLINGVPSKVAIKVKDEQYKNANITGVIKDSENVAISAFKIFEFGFGSSTFTPEPNKSYYASILFNGKEEKYSLPKALPQGFGLNVLNHGNELVLKATSTNDIGLKNAFIIAHQRGEVVFQKLIETITNKVTVKFNTAKFNSGVTSITLFTNDGKPVCERLVFIDNPASNANVQITKNESTPKIREKVTLELDLKDPKGNPLSGNVSLAVNDLQSVQKNFNDETIKTYLLLNSDLRGEIENPGYFFEKGKESKRRFLLDLVMLTHGWSRFTWKELLYSPPKTKDKYAVEKGVFISGQTQALKDRRNFISAATRLTLLEEGKTPIQEPKQSDTNGQFKYGPYVFFDSVPIFVEARAKDFKSENSKNRNVHVSIRKEIFQSPRVTRANLIKKSKVNKVIVTSFMEQALNSYKIDTAYFNSAQRLKEIVIRAKNETAKEERKQALDDMTDYGSPSRRLDINEVIGGQGMSMLTLLSRLPGVYVTNNSVTVRNGRRPLILLDDFEVEFEDISYLTGSDVEFIDLLTGAAASFYSGSANGVIAVYTKTGEAFVNNTKREPGIINFEYPGFYTAREFYAPDYADSFYDHSKPDYRTTLHWEPKIEITKDAKAEITFFTCDKRTDYAIEIEGITDDGTPVYEYTTFVVE